MKENNKYLYDYLIVGAGFFGSVCARELTNLGYRCLVIDKRNHIGGNCYSENNDNINIHKYGAHIFNTSNNIVWEYINKYAEFNQYKYNPKVYYKNALYSFPINLFTLYQIFNVKTPSEAINKLNDLKININNPSNLEEYCLSIIGEELYKIFIYGYTKKQWNTEPKKLPISIIKRIPIRFDFNDNYFYSDYQGIPIGGYTKIFEKLLSNIEIKLNTNYFNDREYFNTIANNIIYSGRIDEFYNFKFGKLEYRTLNFKTIKYDINDYQGCAVINYTDIDIPYTRIIEHKHFEQQKNKLNYTYVTKETPIIWNDNEIPFYPINNIYNDLIYDKYKNLSLNEKNVTFGGRLGDYKYYNMWEVINNALILIKNGY